VKNRDVDETRPIARPTTKATRVTTSSSFVGPGVLRSGEWRCCGRIRAGSCKACPVCGAERPEGLGACDAQ
jgi:hypothetical protein